MKTLIITNKYDQSTCDVIDWLRYYNKEHIVLIDETEYSLVKIDMNGSYTLKVNDCILNSNEISSIWFRRGGLHLEPIEIIESSDESISASFCHYYNVASEVLGGFIQNSFLRQKSINNQKYQSVNKLEALQTAKAHGIKVPETIVTTKKTVLKDFISKYKNVITKDLTDGIGFRTNDWHIYAYTEILTSNLYNSLTNDFAPSLFQELIDKKFEIRSFFLHDTFYSMAIFSQSNAQTRVDYRHYDRNTPNRRIPFKMPKDIENKLKSVLLELNLNSASIDLIYSTQKEFVFLEINPIGQFGMVSYPCNYQIEKLIAEYL